LSPAEKQEKVTRVASEHGPLEKEWDRKHQINDREIVRATIVGGGLAGLGAALNARDEETVYALVAYQLWEVQEGRVDLSRPECGFRYGDTDTPDACGPTQYHRNDNEAFCRFILDRTSLKQFWGESNDGIIADDKIHEELDRSYDKYIVGHLDDDGPVDEARRRLSDAEDEETHLCLSAHQFNGTDDPKIIDECDHTEQAVRDSKEEMGLTDLLKRYMPDSQ
jgi:succinate dehydrogenase/fumarate reductase flavoprotein subunit